MKKTRRSRHMAQPDELLEYLGVKRDGRTKTGFRDMENLPVEFRPEDTIPGNLPVKHRLVILMHLEGYSGAEIANEVRLAPGTVYNILKSPAAENIIQQYFEFADAEFRSLYALAIKAVKDNLLEGDLDQRLRAADKFMKAHGKYEKAGDAADTAEDVVSRIMEMRKADGSVVKLTEKRRQTRIKETSNED